MISVLELLITLFVADHIISVFFGWIPDG